MLQKGWDSIKQANLERPVSSLDILLICGGTQPESFYPNPENIITTTLNPTGDNKLVPGITQVGGKGRTVAHGRRSQNIL